RSPMSYFRSWMAVPLMLKDRSLGSLSLVHAEPGFFRPEHVELASTVANHIAIAIENARLFEEGSRKAHQLETLLDTSRAIASTLELQQLFEVTMDRLRDLIPYTGGGIGLELDGRQLIGATRRPGADTSPIPRRPGWLESKTMRSLRAGIPIVIDDLRGDEPLAVDFRSWLLADIAETPLAYARSLMAVPLIVRGAAVGDVSLTHERPGYFTHEHVELVQTVANHLAIAIENARLFEESSRKARELGALLELSRSMASTLDLEELFEVTLDRLQDLVPHSGGSISLRTQEGLRYSTTRRPSGDESLLQRRPGWSESNYMKAISRGMPVLIDDLRGDEPLAVEYRSWLACDIEESPVAYARSMLAVPLVVKGMAFGDVTLAHERPAYFRKEHAELVQTVANHLAIAIENARLFDETSRKAAEVAALLQANEVLHRSLSLPEVFQALVDVSVDVLRVDMSAVLLRDAPDRPLRVRAQRGFDPDKIEAARDEVAALDLQLPETGSQWVVSDTLGDPRASQPLTVGLDMRATLQVPLRVGSALGVFVFGYRAPRSWSADEVRLCQSLAERASAAIENALLFEQSESHARELEALYKADEKLFSSLDLDAVLQNLADISVDILGAEKSLVLMADDVGAGLRPKAWRNMSPALVAYFSREHPYVGDVRSPDGEFEDLDASHPDHSFLSAEGVRAGMEVAIVGEGRRYGSFAVAYSRRHSFSTEEKRVLGALAARAAVAIRNAALFARAQQAASLEERQRLARELHDSVSQALYGIALGARTARTQLDREPEKAAEPLNYVLSLAEAGLAEMRALIFELRPESLESEGLVAALEKQVSATRARHGLEVQASLCAEPDVAVEVKEAAYRIAQEALHNVVKHSQARSVRLVLAAEGDALRLTVADDGRGFDPDSDFPGHMGLRSMRERAERAGGTLTIDAAPGRGAAVTAVFPLP
ncbi:MAG TPA: GAF domain-containing protein, partial [Dehalococcoidia bacterium]|nr:GAF domain-containing protein [Dehalococcoidia bacterium]